MTETICPYTGLRPFTEDESIYFKGRDEHIEQATRQLGKNKFLILTGASGDGKSSLVYAGIIPNAKAGFLKSKYSNWALADFRPERNPLRNLSESLAQVLSTNPETVKAELSHGFSALIDLYEASPLCTDEGSPEKKRRAANLIILADQFEEFFTNPENFQGGAPSQEAALVTNLLLETARIALERDLPVYVIITMRSDFIGQCAAFRGLPEYIGFSQFFVPRLNRVQLKEVIEEPAVLSGNRIAPRLTERLIHDMAEGNDQLPILQHALNQIWEVANTGQEEMDLIHYAMVGGMKGQDLATGDATRFKGWFESLPAKVKECYDQPGLENVLNTHANKLYILADDYLKEEYGEQVNEADALAIVETTFKCLTKIDSSRAVRNRMTLAEITAILNQPHIDHKKVGALLNIFREPGNTLLRPFIEEVPELQPDTVLDITHESLIRNWERLESWANEEYHNLTTYLDFRVQVKRWLDHNRSGGFLLYIGPLTFFENWFEKAKPNEAWLARYVKASNTGADRKIKASQEIVEAREFLRRSARKHLITRAVMRYGPKRIAAIASLVILLVLGFYGIRSYLRTRNSAVLAEIKTEAIELINRGKATKHVLAIGLLEHMDNGRLTPDEIAKAATDPIRSADILSSIAVVLSSYSNLQPKQPLERCLILTDSLMSGITFESGDVAYKARALQNANDLSATLLLIRSRVPGELTDQLVKRNAQRVGQWTMHILKTQPAGYSDMSAVYRGINNALTFGGFTPEQIQELTSLISPFENKERSAWLREHYQKDRQQELGWFNYSLNYNGLFQLLGHLYGAGGDINHALQCMDTVLTYRQNYFQQRYTFTMDNATNVAGFLYQYGHEDAVRPFVEAYIRKSGEKIEEFYNLLMGRSMIDDRAARTAGIGGGSYKPASHNLEAATVDQLVFFAEREREAIEATARNSNEKNFLLANCYKNAGVRIYRKLKEAGSDSTEHKTYPYFDKAMTYFGMVNASYLDESIPSLVSFSDNISRRGSFFFLDFSPLIEFGDFRRGNFGHSTDGFLSYTLDKGILSSWMQYAEGPGAVEDWIWCYNVTMELPSVMQVQPSDRLTDLGELMEGKETFGRNLNILYINLVKQAGERGDTATVRRMAARIKPENFRSMLSFAIPNRGFFYTTIFRATSVALLEISKVEGFDLTWSYISGFKKPANRALLSSYIARELLKTDPNSTLAARFIDSAKAMVPRVSSTTFPVFRAHILEALAYQKGDKGIEEGLLLTKNVGDKVRIQNFVGRSLAYRNELYNAYRWLSPETSDENRSQYFVWLLSGLEAGGHDARNQEWKNYHFTYIPIFEPFFYSDENQ